jgi:hypothetical protein
MMVLQDSRGAKRPVSTLGGQGENFGEIFSAIFPVAKGGQPDLF